MKLSLTLTALATCLLYGVSRASPVLMARQEQSGVVTMPIAKRSNSALSKRDAISTNIQNGFKNGLSHYYIQVQVGTPPQHLQLAVDTGSSDTWLFGPKYCGIPGADCYNPNASSTYKPVGPPAPLLSTKYGSGAVASGPFFNDNLQLANIEVKDLQMAVITAGNKQVAGDVGHGGIMGLGFDTGEADITNGKSYFYPTIIDTMYAQGLINTRAVSVYLDDADAATGNLIFGGYDTAKYQGELTTFNIDFYGLDFPRVAVPLTSIAISDPSKGSSDVIWSRDLDAGKQPLAAVLDSGAPSATLPLVAWKAIFASLKNDYGLNATANKSTGEAIVVPCDALAKIKAGVDFGFTDPTTRVKTTINIPFVEAVAVVSGNDCAIGYVPPTDNSGYIFLGDPVMRSMYLVFDYDKTSISMAQASFNVKESNVIPL